MTIAADMTFDGCSIELEGSKMLFRSGTVTVMSDSAGNSAGSILMTIDGDTGDAPEIIGENGAKVVDLHIGMGGTVNMQAGTIQDMKVSNSKDGLLVVGSGGTLMMSGGSQILGSDLTGMGSFYPIVYSNGGNIQVTTGQISGMSNTGTGLSTVNAFVNANGLTVSNAYAGVRGEDSALTLDGFTSTGNTYGVVAEGAMTLPKMYRSATLQNPPISPYNGMNACLFGWWNACGHWQTYSIDFSTYLGNEDYLQTGMEVQFGGHIYDPYSGWTTPYLTMDNLKITMSDNLGQSWTVDSSNDLGYYPYGAADPTSGTTAATYAGGNGGVPSWDCEYRGFTYSPYSSYGAYGSRNYAGPGTMGGFFGVGAWGYPAEFGFRWTASDNPNIASDPFPGFDWGRQHRYFLPYASYVPNLTPSGDVCGAVAYPRLPTLTQAGSSGILNFPIVDISDTSLTSVKMEVDIWHTYYSYRTGYHGNNQPD
ncbi:MAG TPA: hypothetical protein QF621_05830, partial [Candidatus Thalassarchaeaceae archaeon]|nr:hypothetical protein [Candidatus Thalassarchaeaceae archaeon]